MSRDLRRAGVLVPLVALALVIWAAQAGVLAATGSSESATPLQSCLPGIPLVKCNVSLYSPPPGVTPPPVTDSFPLDVPQTVDCGSTFFDSVTSATLTDRFGSIYCFRFISGDRWIVFGDGMSVTSPDFEATPGGSMIAVDACATGDTTCLDPGVLHSFADFVVSYPPNPLSGRSNLQDVGAGHLIQVLNGFCGLFTFDVTTLQWYGASADDLAALESAVPVTPAFQGAAVPGVVALTQTPPPYVGGCAS